MGLSKAPVPLRLRY